MNKVVDFQESLREESAKMKRDSRGRFVATNWRDDKEMCLHCVGTGWLNADPGMGGESCHVCGGSGWVKKHDCGKCGGIGIVFYIDHVDRNGIHFPAKRKCEACNGTGYKERN